jgi:catechol 2,3-dioxygenase-like lactoylglutathione lyase family enzyme
MGMATMNLYGEAGANVLRAAHAEFRVTDLGAARHFYVDLLGFVETERTDDALYLRCLEEREHHSLILRRAESPGLTHMAYRVADPDDLDRLSGRFAALGLPQRWVEAGAAGAGSGGVADRVLSRDGTGGAAVAAVRPLSRAAHHAPGSF